MSVTTHAPSGAGPDSLDACADGTLALVTAEPRAMRHYAVFGGCLQSEVEFPDLVEVEPQPASWTLRLGRGAPPTRDGAMELGQYDIGWVQGRLFRCGSGLLLSYAPHGECLLRPGGCFEWFGGEPPSVPLSSDEFLRSVVLGPVLALELHRSGTLTLHGSAVSIDGRAIGMVAPKLHGKSTLALALVRAGAALVTDDAIAVDLDEPVRVRPGVHSVRVFDDSMQELSVAALPSRIVAGAKNTLVDLPAVMRASGRTPIDVLYLLQPVHATPDGPAVSRAPVPPAVAAVVLARHTKVLGRLVGLAMAGEQLRWAAAVARHVPVYVLAVARDYQRLPEVVGQLLRWQAQDSERSNEGRS